MADLGRRLTSLGLFVGDLLHVDVPAICTSTNPWLSLQAGTGGAVRMAAGHELQGRCDAIVAAEHARTGRRFLPMGSTHATPAGALGFKAVIHCVAIDAFHGSTPQTIRECVLNAIRTAESLGLDELAMPVFATGHGRFPFEQAVEAMLAGLGEPNTLERVWIVVPDIDRADTAFNLIEAALGRRPWVVCQPDERLDRWCANLYQDVLHGNHLQLPPSARDTFQAEARRVLGEVDVRGLRRLLWVPNWRNRIVAAWLAGVKGYAHLAPLIGDLLVRSELTYAGQGYCFALARFQDETSAEFLTGYLDTWLPETGRMYEQDWALAALCELDARRGSLHAARFLVPGGPWERFNHVARQDLDRTRGVLDQMLETARALGA